MYGKLGGRKFCNAAGIALKYVAFLSRNTVSCTVPDTSAWKVCIAVVGIACTTIGWGAVTCGTACIA